MQIHCLAEILKEKFPSHPLDQAPCHGCDIPISTLSPIKPTFESYITFWGEIKRYHLEQNMNKVISVPQWPSG